MTRQKKPRPVPVESRILGVEAFAAISAVEGISLSVASAQRIDSLRGRRLSANEQRAEVIRAYLSRK
jgi:hypothetical protein